MKTDHPASSTQAQFEFHILGELALTSAELLSWVTVKIAVGSLELSSLKLMGLGLNSGPVTCVPRSKSTAICSFNVFICKTG